MMTDINIRSLDINIFDEPIIGEIKNPVYYIYFNRKHGQIKFPITVQDVGIDIGGHVMFYPIFHEPGKLFVTPAIVGEKGRKISQNSKKDNSHKMCFGNKKFFTEMDIAVQPPSGRTTGKEKVKDGEKGFTVMAEPVNIQVRGEYRIGLLIDISPYQKELEYAKINNADKVEA